MKLINWPIFLQPVNWLIVVLMLVIAATALSLIIKHPLTETE